MRLIEIKPSEIQGIISCSGSKNITLPLIACTLLTRGRCILNNVPDILDVRIMLDICNHLGVKTYFKDNQLTIDSTSLSPNTIPKNLIEKIRASYYFLPIILPLVEKYKFSFPGGCLFQERPINFHLEAFKQFGVNVRISKEIEFEIDELKATNIIIPKKSVGATINIILLALSIKGTTKIINPSLDVEVLEVIKFLKKAKGKIQIENQNIIVEGSKLSPVDFTILNDRIENGTYALLGASCGKISILNFDPVQNKILLDLFDSLSIKYRCHSFLVVEKSYINYPLSLVLSNDNNHLHTDLGPILVAFLLRNTKISIIEDIVYPQRLSYIDELIKLGAKIRGINNKIIIFPHSNFLSTKLIGKDLRGTMSLIIGAIISKKEQIVEGYEYLLRGYENIIDKLMGIEVAIKEIKND